MTVKASRGEAKPIKAINKLAEIEYRKHSHDVTDVVADINAGLAAIGIEMCPPADGCSFVEKEKPARHGVAFAVSKCDNGFVEKLSQFTFRYRDSEVQDVLRKVIEKHGLRRVIYWDRGFCMFVFNVYFKAKKGDAK